MSRNRLFVIAVVLALTSFTSLFFGISLQRKDIRSYIASHYREYSHDADGTRYLCEGSPAKVANTLAGYQTPAAYAAHLTATGRSAAQCGSSTARPVAPTAPLGVTNTVTPVAAG